jgi:hypothetical protein
LKADMNVIMWHVARLKGYVRGFPYGLLLVFGALIGWTESVAASVEVSCQCEPLRCGPCETEDGLDFYSEKCGPRGAKTKSCKRPLCRPVKNHKVCLSKLPGSHRPSGEDENALSGSEPVGTTEKQVPNAAKRAPASINYGEANRSAEVVLAKGSVSVIRLVNLGRSLSHSRSAAKGSDPDLESEKSPLRTGERVQIGDRILTGADGRVRLRFSELSEIFVSPNSGVVVDEALLEKRNGPPKRTIILDLRQGRLRSRVQGRYNDGESRFLVKTRSAVAGVRGTDFVVSFHPGPQEWKTEVHTISGEVCFGRDPECKKPFMNSGVTAPSSKAVFVGARSYAAFVAQAPPSEAHPEDIDALMDKGFLSPVFRMTEDDVERLKEETDVKFDDQAASGASNNSTAIARNSAISALSDETCASPAGLFNQCSWTCEGNPKGAQRCRTDLPGVRCVRRLCRANGQWAEPTALPGKRGRQECEAQRTVVQECGTYW